MSGSSFVVLYIAASFSPATMQDSSAPEILVENPAPENIDTSPDSAQLMLPVGHPVSITVDQEISSKTSKSGDYFSISLSAPVVIEGTEVLPTGATGRGQVVHAKKGGFAGSAGELVLAARYIEHDGRQIMLRSFKFPEASEVAGGTGQDNTGLVTAVNIAAGPIGFFISGGNIVVAPGSVATAKFKEDTYFSAGTVATGSSGPADDEIASEIITDTIQEGLE